MVYADFSYYQETFFGVSVGVGEFDRLALRASAYIDYITMGKAAKKAELDAVKMCCCALADQYKAIYSAAEQNADGKELKSESVGSWSRTYSTGTELEQAARAQLQKIAYEYLAPTGLLYRGVSGCVSSCCECI